MSAHKQSAVVQETKRYKSAPSKSFQCRGFGECRMVFSRSEHLARHVRYVCPILAIDGCIHQFLSLSVCLSLGLASPRRPFFHPLGLDDGVPRL
ncbi:hypothetical protein DL93DRAFT_2088706 [Clavulina sp. PMI_390]|nr:hypothetical protein DL93DRAFT_2088706 [Clavulina sp. PMI_390]